MCVGKGGVRSGPQHAGVCVCVCVDCGGEREACAWVRTEGGCVCAEVCVSTMLHWSLFGWKKSILFGHLCLEFPWSK